MTLTPNQMAELEQQHAAITEVFGTNWQACEDGDISVRTEDGMPGFYTEVFSTSQRMGHDEGSPLADFLINAVNRLPDLLAEVKRLREHIAFVLDAARARDKEMLHLRDTHKASKRTQTRGHAWEEAAYEVRKIAELLERVDSPA